MVVADRSFAGFVGEWLGENSLVTEEGKYRLAEEFGSEQGTYFSILACIATGKTSRSDIESVLEVSVGSYLQRLESEFDIVTLNELEKTALIIEVKRNPKNIRLSKLQEKVVRLELQLKGYNIEYRGLSLEDLLTNVC